MIKSVEPTPRLAQDFRYLQSRLSLLPKAEQIHCVFGPQSSGKSALICTLSQAVMSYKQPAGLYQINRFSQEMPQIGTTKSSHPKNPGIFRTLQGKVFYESPDLSSQGNNEEVLNAYGLTKVLEAGNKIKIIIVMDYQTIQSEPDKLYQIVYQLERLFESEFYSVINSCVLVVTKANKEEDDGLEILIDQLKRKSQNQRENEEIVRILLKTLCRKQYILSFSIPTQFNRNDNQMVISTIKKIPNYSIKGKPAIKLSSTGKQKITILRSYLQKNIEAFIDLLMQGLWQNYKQLDQQNRIIKMKEIAERIKDINKIKNDIKEGKQINLSRSEQQLLQIYQAHVDQLNICIRQLQFCCQRSSSQWRQHVWGILQQLTINLRQFNREVQQRLQRLKNTHNNNLEASYAERNTESGRRQNRDSVYAGTAQVQTESKTVRRNNQSIQRNNNSSEPSTISFSEGNSFTNDGRYYRYQHPFNLDSTRE